jgi:hypothetical protein
VRLIVAFLLMTLTAAAWAEWVKYAETTYAAEYYDPATIGNKGPIRRVWMITDLKQRGQYAELSQRYLSEYDCKDNRWRILFVSAHSERMAGGETLGTDESAYKWNAIAPETAPGIVLKIVCQQPGRRFI